MGSILFSLTGNDMCREIKPMARIDIRIKLYVENER